MTSLNQNVIRHKIGLLNLATELGNVSEACKVMGHSIGATMQNLTQRLAYWAEQQPEKAAIVTAAETVSYASLHARVRLLAEKWLERGWQDKTLVVMLGNGLELAIVYYTAFLTANRLVPLNPQLSSWQIEHILAQFPDFIRLQAPDYPRCHCQSCRQHGPARAGSGIGGGAVFHLRLYW